VAEIVRLLRGLQPSGAWLIYGFRLLCRRRVSERLEVGVRLLSSGLLDHLAIHRTRVQCRCRSLRLSRNVKTITQELSSDTVHNIACLEVARQFTADLFDLTIWSFGTLHTPNANTTDTYILSSPSGMKRYPLPLHLVLFCNDPYPCFRPQIHRTMYL